VQVLWIISHKHCRCQSGNCGICASTGFAFSPLRHGTHFHAHEWGTHVDFRVPVQATTERFPQARVPRARGRCPAQRHRGAPRGIYWQSCANVAHAPVRTGRTRSNCRFVGVNLPTPNIRRSGVDFLGRQLAGAQERRHQSRLPGTHSDAIHGWTLLASISAMQLALGPIDGQRSARSGRVAREFHVGVLDGGLL
jgi:hypothetical protein